MTESELRALESALAREQEISLSATQELAQLAHREVQIAQTHRPRDAAAPDVAGWTLQAYMQHQTAIRELDFRFYEERDRRYAEVNVEKEKALKIKETADLAALQLAREIQTYKDEKANELRSQIESERGNYATKADVTQLDEKNESRNKTITGKLEDAVSNWQREHSALTSVVETIRREAVAQPEIRELERTTARGQGGATGRDDLMARGLATLAVVVSIAVLIVLIVHN